MMKRKICLLFIICHLSFSEAQAQVATPKDTPQLEFAMQLRVTLGQTYTLGETPHGRRIVIPITGGTFEGLCCTEPFSMAEQTISWPTWTAVAQNWRLSIVFKPTMEPTSTYAIAASSTTARMHKGSPPSISRQHLSSRLPRTVPTTG